MDLKARTQVEISMGLRNLRSKDMFSKSDPCIIVFEKQRKAGWVEVARTEVIMNKHNPNFKKRLKMSYYFERRQEMKFEVWDWDTNAADKSTRNQDYIGCVETTLANLVVDSGMPRKVMKRSGRVAAKGRARMVINCDELKEDGRKCYMQISGIKLPKMDFGLFSKSDPYLQIFRQSNQSWIKIYQTEVIPKTLDPRWKPITLKVADMCGGDEKRPILFRVWDHDKVGSHDLIGEFQVTLGDIKQGSRFGLRRPKKKKDKNYGHLEFSEAKHYRDANFLDYIRGGMEVNVMYAIDYTGSNRDPSNPSSLHYILGSKPSPYADAISKITSILSPYDKDQKIPVYGFGARIKSTSRVSHCFPLNFNSSNPEVHGLQGVLNAYHGSFSKLLLSGPTYFSEVLQLASAVASSHTFSSTKQGYTILVILTDGVIDDMRNTIESIVNMADLPISIVIIGIGKANFDAMNRLDGDDGALTTSSGRKASRDIVQFVPMRQYVNNPYGLTDATLAEIPEQVINFAKKKKVAPIKQVAREWNLEQDYEDVKTGTVLQGQQVHRPVQQQQQQQQQQYNQSQTYQPPPPPPSQQQHYQQQQQQRQTYAPSPSSPWLAQAAQSMQPQQVNSMMYAPPQQSGYMWPGQQQHQPQQQVQYQYLQPQAYPTGQQPQQPTTVQVPTQQVQNLSLGGGGGGGGGNDAPPAYFSPAPPPG